MRVSIDHKETTKGLIFQKPQHEVHVTVRFSDEERAVIDQRRLRDRIVLKRRAPEHVLKRFNDEQLEILGDAIHLKISDLIKGTDVYKCETPLDAKAYEQEVTEALKDLKKFIELNAEAPAASRTFEL
jgi:hypothetical protein